MRTIATTGAVLLLAVGVGRGDPPSGPATPVSPPPTPISLPSLPPIPPADNLPWKTDGKLWQKTQPIDTPAPLPVVPKQPADKGEPPPADKGGKSDRPDAKKLKEEVEKLLKESTDKAKDKSESTPTGDRAEMLKQLEELVGKVEQQKKTPKPATPPKPGNPNDHPDPHATQPGKPLLPEGGKPIDLVRAAGNLYKAGDPEGAFETLKVIDTNQLPKEDRAFADYVRAACLRKLGRPNDALKLYRAIADAKDDPFLAESAVVQITAIKSAQELEAQLEQLKSRRKPK